MIVVLLAWFQKDNAVFSDNVIGIVEEEVVSVCVWFWV